MAKYTTVVYLAGSASAEFFADVGLCPMEAVKVRVTTIQVLLAWAARPPPPSPCTGSRARLKCRRCVAVRRTLILSPTTHKPETGQGADGAGLCARPVGWPSQVHRGRGRWRVGPLHPSPLSLSPKLSVACPVHCGGGRRQATSGANRAMPCCAVNITPPTTMAPLNNLPPHPRPYAAQPVQGRQGAVGSPDPVHDDEVRRV